MRVAEFQSIKSTFMKNLMFTLVLTVLCSMQLLAQNRTIVGRVLDEEGSAIANASVTIKGSSIASKTRADGSFSLSIPYNMGTIIVSSSGYLTEELYLTTSRTSFNISLKRIGEIVLDTAEMVVDTVRTILDTAEIAFDETHSILEEQVVVPYGSI